MLHIRLGLAVAGLLAVVGCTSSPTAAPQPVSPAPTTEAPPAPTTTTETSAPAAASETVEQRFEKYYALMTPAEWKDPKPTVRKKFDQSVLTHCPGGLEQMKRLKDLASTAAGRTAAQQKTANDKAARSIGGLWEFGCQKGHDADLYTPVAVKAQGKSWPCEPGYPNCTKAESERYQSQLEYKNSTATRDARGETKEEYCKRTGQHLATCQAG